MPSLRATACALPALSPVSMMLRTPTACSAATAAAAVSLTVSPKASSPNRLRMPSFSTASQDTV